MTPHQKPPYTIFGLRYHWYLIAALGLSNYNLYTNGEESIAWTRETGESIHRKTVFEVAGGSTVPLQDYKSDGFLYFSRSTVTESERGDMVCVTESEGLRIPYTNVALSSSVGECSVGEFAARSVLHTVDRPFLLRH